MPKSFEQDMEVHVANKKVSFVPHKNGTPMYEYNRISRKKWIKGRICLDRCYLGRTGGVAITPFPKKSLMVPNLSRESCNDILK